MTAPYVGYAKTKDMMIASIVVDEDEFMSLVDEFKGIISVVGNNRMAEEQVEALKKARHVPLIKKGEKTKFIFERYGVKKDVIFAAIVVRGMADEIIKRMGVENIMEAAKNLEWLGDK
jgi:hypothetical protein